MAKELKTNIKKLRILHLHSSIGGNAYNLSIGEKKNGMDSTVLIDNPDIYSNKGDIVFRNIQNKYLNIIRKMMFCVINCKKYDIIHYNFGSMFIETKKFNLFGWDLKYFKKHGKIIAVTFQGSDARQAKYCVNNYKITHYTREDEIQQNNLDIYKIERIKFYEKYADLIYATNPDLLNVLPSNAKFRPYTKLQPIEWIPSFSNYKKRKIVIIHAPSKQKVKGTKYVLKAIRQLKEEGYEIDFRLLQNIPNEEIVNYYKDADLVIDQLLVGWYGGFAVECMALGKPVACYIREDDLKYIPEEMRREIPIIRVDKDNLYERVKYYLDNRHELEIIAHNSRKFVDKWHDPTKIAKKIIDDYMKCIN